VVGQKKVHIMPYDPRKPHHERYVQNPPAYDKKLLKRVEQDALKLCQALGYDLNTVEFAVEDGIPYAIDFMNPAPDADLHSVGQANFDWIVKEVADLAIAKAKRRRSCRSCGGRRFWGRRRSLVGLKPVHSARNGSITYAPAFRFNVPGTHFSTVVSRTSSNPPAFKWGERVTVRYPAGHPEQAVIDSFGQLWLRVWAFGGFGAVFCGTALLPPIFSMLRKPRDLPSPNPNSDGAVGIIRRG
jgi:hypothetical protein